MKERTDRVDSLLKELAKRVDSFVKERAKRLDSPVEERAIGICRFFNFDRPVNRFLGGFRPNRLDHRVLEVEAVQNIYRFMGF